MEPHHIVVFGDGDCVKFENKVRNSSSQVLLHSAENISHLYFRDFIEVFDDLQYLLLVNGNGENIQYFTINKYCVTFV